ncbi:MAG: hypothetical protein DI616_15625 [Paracoccus denitrificans]|uniref:Uncharacterized protein n=1 Tax=Paracoccus denitrificans TaxID=266 RepID=A0A533I325_PARDE|nr:MAG: hypothetical protein DI616_15625 [Paracoccus denitrificans]
MTPVRFKFLTPLGVPISDALFYVSLNKAAIHKMEHGFVHPEVIEGLTDAQGEATLTLFPANQPYYVTMDTSAVINDEQQCAAIRFRIAVPSMATEVWADDLVVTDPIFSQPWDAEAIEVIMQAKAAAAASASAAKTSELNAKDSEILVVASAQAAAASKTAAAGSAATAAASKTAADLSATAAGASKAAAALSEQSASASANSALSSANTATTAADKAKASETAAAGSATVAGGHATTATAAKDAAAASAAAALASRTASADSELAAKAAQTGSEAARDKALAAAAAITGVISDMGAWDASTGSYPAKPQYGSAFWKVTVGGTVDGVQYGVGDTLMYTRTLGEFYKIDNTESVTSVNGKTGTVVITKGDVGLDIGLGAYNAQSGADLNTYTIPGTLVSTAAGASNSPISVIGGYLRVVGGVNATLASQVWTEQVGNQVGYTPRSWTRSLYTADNWSPWSLTIAGSNWLPLTVSTNANLLTEANVTYHVQGSTVTNLPLAATGFLRVLFRGDSGGAALRCVQEYTPYEPANGSTRVWRRTRDETNVWSAWFRTDTGALGTAAQGTLTTSPTDTTAGRVLKVGDFGVGGMVPSLGAVNLDTAYLMSGNYYVAEPTNGPSGFSGFGFLRVTRLGGTTSQVLTSYSDGRTYKRARPDTGQPWTAWVSVLTSAEVVDSVYTATVNKVVSTGAFGHWMGLGAVSLPAVANMDNIANTCFYTFNDTAVGRPPQFGFGNVITICRMNGERTQIAYSVISDTSVTRKMSNSTWGPWVMDYNQTNAVGPVSFTSGVNSGAVIERGGSTYGQWTKYADGTMECWSTVALSCPQSAGDLPATIAMQMPQSFADTGYVTTAWAHPRSHWSGFSGLLSCLQVSTSVFNATIRNTVAAQTVTIGWRSIGRWR